MTKVEWVDRNVTVIVEEFMASNGIMQITHCRTPMTFGDIELPQSYSAVLVGGRWLHGATIADILEQI